MLLIQILAAIDAADIDVEDAGARRDLIAEVFAREGRSLVRLARIFTDDHNAAEDLVQEAFIRLYRNAHKIEDPSKAPAYMRSIVLNLCRDHNRRGLMSLRHQQSERDVDTSLGPDATLVQTEEQATVIDALLSLSQRQRECLVLRFYLDLSEPAIAATLGISPNSVKTHSRRAMAALRDRLGETA